MLARKTIAGILYFVFVLITLNSIAFAQDTPTAEISLKDGKKAMLANNGRAIYEVFVISDAGDIERNAAEELVNYLTKVTGAPFQLSVGVNLPNGPTVLVGRNAMTENLIPELAGDTLGEDGFVIRKTGQYIVIAGSHSRGTMYGVNYFLDHYVGLKWYSPQYTFVPNKSKLLLNVDNDVQVPRFEYREIYVNDGNDEHYRAHNLLNGKFYGRVPGSEPSLNSWSNYWPYDVHNFQKIVPQTQYHNGGQLLAMNEDVRRIAADNLVNIINQRISEGKDASYSFSQMDTTWTPDPESKAFADQHGGTLAAPIFDMVGDVAKRVKDRIPNSRIGTLAYMFTEQAPTGLTVPDNVVITFAPIFKDHGRAIDDPKNRFSRENAKQWANISDDILMWDYITDFMGGGYLMPYPNLYAMSETIQSLAQIPAFKGYFGQHMHSIHAPASTGLTDLRTWIGARLLWNPNQDYRQLIEEFVSGYYGDAAPYISEYIKVLHEAFAQSDSKLTISTPIMSSYLSFDVMRHADELFAQAAAAVADNPEFLKHVQRTRIEVDYVILLRSVDFMQEARKRNIDWEVDFDNRYARFKTYTADIKHYKINGKMEALYNLFEIRRTIPPVPDFVKHLPGTDWVDYQDDSFQLYDPVGTTIVQDPEASDNAAARVKGSTNAWAIQLPNYVLPREGRWKLYANVRVDPGDGSTGSKAFDYGIYPPMANRASMDYAGVADGNYHFVEFPWIYEYDPTVSNQYLWLAPPNSTAIQNLYVDRVIAVRQ